MAQETAENEADQAEVGEGQEAQACDERGKDLEAEAEEKVFRAELLPIMSSHEMEAEGVRNSLASSQVVEVVLHAQGLQNQFAASSQTAVLVGVEALCPA